MTIDRVARAPGKLFVAGGVNDDGVLEGTYFFIIGALAFVDWFLIRYSHAMQKSKSQMLCEWSVVRVFPFL